MTKELYINKSVIDAVLCNLKSNIGLEELSERIIDSSTIDGAVRCRESFASADILRRRYVECESSYCELANQVIRKMFEADREISESIIRREN